MSCNGVHVCKLHNMYIRNVYTQLVSMTCLHVQWPRQVASPCIKRNEFIYVYQHPTKAKGILGWVEPVATSHQPYNIIFLPFNYCKIETESGTSVL